MTKFDGWTEEAFIVKSLQVVAALSWVWTEITVLRMNKTFLFPSEREAIITK